MLRLILVTVTLALFGCGSDNTSNPADSGSGPACIAGSTRACTCANGASGEQECVADAGYAACVCAATMPDAGGGGTADARVTVPDAGTSCTPQNCTGCCFGGVCQAGNTISGCGKGAAACVSCMTNQICKTDQTCGVDPDSMWQVQPTAAGITATNNGNNWDIDSSPPDPYVVTTCPPASSPVVSMTPFVADTLSPTWTTGGCVAKASALLAEHTFFQVFDDDVGTDDNITRKLFYQFTEADFVDGTVSFQAIDAITSFDLELKKQ